MAIKPERYVAKDGTVSWRVRLETGRDPVTGARRRQWVTKPTERECKAEAVRLLNELRQGSYTAPQPITVREFLARFLAAEKGRIRANSYKNLKSAIKCQMVPFLGAIKLQDLSSLHIVDWLAWMRETQGLSATSVRTHRDTLSRALVEAGRWDLVSRNVAVGVKAPPEDAAPPVALSFDETAAFLAEAAGNRYEVLFILGLATGMRLGELLGLRWEDCELEPLPGLVRVREQMAESYDGGRDFAEPKTPTSKRVVTLPPAVADTLRHFRARDNERRLADPTWNPERLVVVNTKGKHAWPTEIGIHVTRLVAKAGVRPFTPHDMRHTHISQLGWLGVHPAVIAERVGHRHVSMTLHYHHTHLGQDAAAAAALGAAFGQAEKTDGPNGGPLGGSFADNADSA